jgi:hypothetical protein
MDEILVRQQLAETLASVRPLVTLARDGLVVTALESRLDRPAAYETATAAARNGNLEVSEHAGGTFATLEAVTKEKPVVIFAGDSVVGGKQNRIINVTVWLPAFKVTPIPVSCLEAHRWNQGYGFAAARKVNYNLRATMSDQLEFVARREVAYAGHASAGQAGRERSFAADQHAIWREIGFKQARASQHALPHCRPPRPVRARGGRRRLDRARVPLPSGRNRDRGGDRWQGRRARDVRLGRHSRRAMAEAGRERGVGLDGQPAGGFGRSGASAAPRLPGLGRGRPHARASD